MPARRVKPGDAKSAQLDQFTAGNTPAATTLTTDQSVAIPNTDDSLKAGGRGPSLIEDFHLREKITHFDHERIPEPEPTAASGSTGHWPSTRRQASSRTRRQSLPSSCAFPPSGVRAARPTPCAMSAGSR